MKSGRKPYYSEFRYYLYIVVSFSLATFLLIYSLSFKVIKFLAFSLLCGQCLTSTHDYWKRHSFDYTDLCQQSDVSTF